MQTENKDTSLEALKEIRGIMDRSARFLSLSGWSGIWAGCTALAGGYIADRWLQEGQNGFPSGTINFIYLALIVFIVAVAGVVFFTWRKAKRTGQKLWNYASRQMVLQIFFPLATGGFFTAVFIEYGNYLFIAPACLAFYGLALISAGKHTLSDIRYLGMLDVALGCISLLFPAYGLYFWIAGFSILHILYGAIMWHKYDKRRTNE